MNMQIRSQHAVSQTRDFTHKLDQRPQRDVRERCVSILSHRDRQNSETRPHRKILMLIRFFAPSCSLMMNAPGGRHVKHFPLSAETITKIQIFTWRTAREERCETSNRLECVTPQRTSPSAEPFARDKVPSSSRKSVRKSRSYQPSGFKAFLFSMNDQTIYSPKQGRRGHWLIDQVSHRRAHSWIGPYRFEEFLDPVSINFHVVINQ